jgi:hypothetical protein
MKARHSRTTKLKHRKEATAARRRGSSAGGLQEQLDLCTRELNEAQRKLDLRTRALSEALDQQKATSEVLRVISNSPIDLPSAPGAIAETAERLAQKCQRWALATRKSRNTWTRATVLSSSG